MIEAGGTLVDAVNHIIRPHRHWSPGSDTSTTSAMDVANQQHALFRELSAIHRSDLTLCVSPFELHLLRNSYGISENKLALCSFFYDSLPQQEFDKLPSFEERKHFCMIGKSCTLVYGSVSAVITDVWFEQATGGTSPTQMPLYF